MMSSVLIALLGCAPASAETTLAFRPDTLVEVAMFTIEPGEEQAIEEKYFSKVFPIAAEYGMQPLGTFAVDNIEHGDVEATQWGFFQWPDRAAKERFEADRRFRRLVDERDARLSELKLLYVTVAEPVSIVLDDDRMYEVFAGWLNRHNGARMQDYFAVAGPWVAQRGAEFHGQFTVVGMPEEYGFSSQPQVLGFMSWPSRSTKAAWFGSDAFHDIGWTRASAVDRLVVLEGKPNR
ncbi:MAG: hypothetical protein AAF602_26105 [Myxococcota bacterium]